jgi:hypothetical protein
VPNFCIIQVSNEAQKERTTKMKDMKAAEALLESKGYYISNQFDGFATLPDEYELSDVNGNVVIDHLSEAQILQISEIL